MVNGRRTATAAAVVVLWAAASGCPTEAAEPSPDGLVTLHLVNNSNLDIAYVYAAPTGSDRWGDDLLAAEECIPAGTDHAVRLAPGTYDLKVEDFYHNEVARLMGVNLTEDMQWMLYDE
jgi:hypothetical protein